MMNKKRILTANAARSDFLWLGEPEFTPPGTNGCAETCLAHEFTAPRIGELRTLLKFFLESIVKTTGAASAVLRLLSSDGRTQQIIGSSGFSANLSEELETFENLHCETIHSQNPVIHASDTSECSMRKTCQHANCQFQSLISVPLERLYSPGTPLGILTIFFDISYEAAIKHKDTIGTLTEMISAAIEHTHINRETRRIELLNERQTIANEIHDSLAQTLTYARMRASMLIEANRNSNHLMTRKYAGDLDEALEIAQKNARELVTNFRCEINHGGLSAALSDLASEFRKRNNIVLEYHNRLIDLELPLEHEIQAYHIVHEALNNIARHSGATHARLFVDAHFGYYVFTIEDNGSGACTFAPVEGHYGVMIMRERAQQIGGTIKVESATGQGTQVQLFFPEPTLDWRAPNE